MKKIKILEFLHREYPGPKGKLIFISCIGSLCFPLVLFIANLTAQMGSSMSTSFKIRLLVIFLIVCIITIVCKRYTLNRAAIIGQGAVRNVRVRLIDKLRHTELQFMERTEKGKIFSRIVQDTELISRASPNLANSFDALPSLIVVFIYISLISLTGFVLAISSIILMYAIIISNYFKTKENLNISRQKEADFIDALNDTLSGFKEIKLNTRKNNALFANIEEIANLSEQVRVTAELNYDQTVVLTYILYELVLAVIVFIVPLFSSSHRGVVTALVAAVLFVFGLLGMLLSGIYTIVKANASVENLEKLEAELDAFGSNNIEVQLPDIQKDFKEIMLQSISFQYTGKQGELLFNVGPINLSIRKNEVLFIVGGNGSGKSTLLKLLTGLYYPMADGHILLDDQPVIPSTYQSYRELFSIIFTDFHIFKKLYGLESVDKQQVEQLLEGMNLQRKTKYIDGKFTKVNLSTGQKKRLAYISALLEDKPIYVFDEWAADQDPTFKKLFYVRFLEDLKAMGKTIIAVTHDDKYFEKADRVIKMEEGKVL